MNSTEKKGILLVLLIAIFFSLVWNQWPEDTTVERPYKYYVSYSHSRGTGRILINSAGLIDSLSDVEAIEKIIVGNGNVKEAIVLFWFLYKDES